MHLYLMRHGQAKAKREDSQRGLTDAGRIQVGHVAEHLAKRNVVVDAVWHSTKARARQTAAIVAPHVIAADKLIERDGICPDDPIAPIVEALAQMDRNLMLVSHLPFVDDLAAALLGHHPTGQMTGCAGVMSLSRNGAGVWQHEWSVDPRDL